jgi:hypothetical protein
MFVGVTHAAVRTACRGEAVRRSTMVGPPPHPHPLRPRRGGEGSARLSEPTGSSRLFPTKQQRDASPWQGEAGAQRRVRVVAVVLQPHHPGCPPRVRRTRRATHRVAPTLPGGKVPVPMNHARFRALYGHAVPCLRADCVTAGAVAAHTHTMPSDGSPKHCASPWVCRQPLHHANKASTSCHEETSLAIGNGNTSANARA